jgi:hypothetical protein
MLPRKQRNPWIRATNELVMTFADKACKVCDGVGAVDLTNQDTGEVLTRVCPCCDVGFKAEYAGRWRRNAKRRCIEIRGLAAVEPS